jgi:hypothetical protein
MMPLLLPPGDKVILPIDAISSTVLVMGSFARFGCRAGDSIGLVAQFPNPPAGSVGLFRRFPRLDQARWVCSVAAAGPNPPHDAAILAEPGALVKNPIRACEQLSNWGFGTD